MRRFAMQCLLASVVLAGAGKLSAAVIACPVMTDIGALLSFNSIANACYSQDTMFWNFIYTPGPSAPTASNVSADLISQTGSIDVHGWNFSADWAQAVAGSLANFTLSFRIQVCNAAPCLANVNPGTVITAADATYAPESVFPPGPETVSWSNGATVTLTSGSPGPLPPNGNIGLGAGTPGPITVTAVFSGTGGITQTSLRFYETEPNSNPLTPVPEPASAGMMLGGIGLIALGFYKRPEARARELSRLLQQSDPNRSADSLVR